jgi:soluble lytic murein transglycosylase-like protein
MKTIAKRSLAGLLCLMGLTLTADFAGAVTTIDLSRLQDDFEARSTMNGTKRPSEHRLADLSRLRTREFKPHYPVGYDGTGQLNLKLFIQRETTSPPARSTPRWEPDYTLQKVSSAQQVKVRQYLDIIEKYARRYNVPVFTVLSVMRAESNFDSRAVSRAGAKGLMQVMPATAYELSQELAIDGNRYQIEKQLFDPDFNIRLGVYLLSKLEHAYRDIQDPNRRLALVLSAYNAGPSRVLRAFSCATPACLRQTNRLSDQVFFERLQRLPKETTGYIDTVFRYQTVFRG